MVQADLSRLHVAGAALRLRVRVRGSRGVSSRRGRGRDHHQQPRRQPAPGARAALMCVRVSFSFACMSEKLLLTKLCTLHDACGTPVVARRGRVHGTLQYPGVRVRGQKRSKAVKSPLGSAPARSVRSSWGRPERTAGHIPTATEGGSGSAPPDSSNE